MNAHDTKLRPLPRRRHTARRSMTVDGKIRRSRSPLRHHRTRRHRCRAGSTRRRAASPTIRASPRPRTAPARSPSSTATRANFSYRGYPIDQLAENTNFLAVCYLLLHGELPTNGEFINFRRTITNHTMVHEQMTRFFTGYRRDAHPMAVMVGTVGALSAFYHDSTDINDPRQREIATHRMIAKMPTIAAMAYKYSIGQPFIYPRNDLDYTSNFLQMCFAVPCEPYIVNPGPLARARPHLHPARRSRAERLDLDGASRGLLGRQSVRLHRGRHRLPLGPRARRRQRSRPQHAAGDRHRRPHPRVHQEGQGQDRAASA